MNTFIIIALLLGLLIALIGIINIRRAAREWEAERRRLDSIAKERYPEWYAISKGQQR